MQELMGLLRNELDNGDASKDLLLEGWPYT